jgi:hypothetical protein
LNFEFWIIYFALFEPFLFFSFLFFSNINEYRPHHLKQKRLIPHQTLPNNLPGQRPSRQLQYQLLNLVIILQYHSHDQQEVNLSSQKWILMKWMQKQRNLQDFSVVALCGRYSPYWVHFWVHLNTRQTFWVWHVRYERTFVNFITHILQKLLHSFDDFNTENKSKVTSGFAIHCRQKDILDDIFLRPQFYSFLIQVSNFSFFLLIKCWNIERYFCYFNKVISFY